jgi:tetratricopeptide (TPR) repeat protein
MSLDTEQRRALNGLGICSFGLGRMEEATDAFKRAIRISERTGDRQMSAILWSNLSAVHEIMGQFFQAAETLGNAIRLCQQTRSWRTGVFVYPHAASVAIQLGNFHQAGEFIKIAGEAARDAGTMVCEVGALIPKAELLIAQGESERAWLIIEEAVERTEGRAYHSGELAGLERLRRQWILATRGYEALQVAATETARTNRIAELFQLRGLQEWAAERQGQKIDPARSVIRELCSVRMYGVIAQLIVHGICPGDLPELRPGESSAQLVARLFPDSAPGGVPQRVPVD